MHINPGKTVKQKPPIENRLLDFKFPPVKERKLPNGLTLMVIERHEIPNVYFRLGIDFGEKHDSPAVKGGVEMMANLLKKGTANRPYDEIVDQVDFVGGALETAFSQDFFYLVGSFLKEYSDIGLELLSDIALNPVFPVEEMAKERANMLANLENEKSSPAFLGHRQLDAVLYAPHPYSLYKTADSLLKISREALIDLHQRYFNPRRSFLIVAGDISFEEATGKVEEYLSAWEKKSPTAATFPNPGESKNRHIYLIDRPGSEQVNVLFGSRMFTQDHPDHEKAVVANKILGGGANSRLFMSLREKKGFTYSASGSLDLYKEAGGWIFASEVRPDVIDKAIREFYAEFDRMANEPVGETELKNAKRYLMGSFPLRNETPASIAALALRQKLYGLPEDFWDNHMVKIDAVTAEDVQGIARTYLQKEVLSIVLVGDAGKIKRKVSKFGKVEILDVEGKSV